MLPLSLLNAAQGQPMLVELKSGEAFNGLMVNCDTWMNLTLKNVIQTSPDGKVFTKVPEAYIRGNLIKYLRLPDELLTEIKEERVFRNAQKEKERDRQSNGRRDGRRDYNRGGGNQDQRGYNKQGGGRGNYRGGATTGGGNRRGGGP